MSCVTAAGVLHAIDRGKYDVVPVGITRSGRWVPVSADPEQWTFSGATLPEVPASEETIVQTPVPGGVELLATSPDHSTRSLGRIDVVLPLLHGPFGEDGTLQGLLELADVRYVGAGVLASALSMDKHYMKVIFSAAGLAVGPYEVITDRQWLGAPERALARAEALGFPLFVKPARAGSSMGITRVASRDALAAAIETARSHDPKVVVEAAIIGREIECAVLEGRGCTPPRTSLPGEIVVAGGGTHEFYDFDAKYVEDNAAVLSCPADLPEEALDRVRHLAAAAFDAVGAEGLSRVDFFYTPEGRLVINEINTMPGFTPKSMYPQMWEKTGLPYSELIDELIQLALCRRMGLR